MMKRAKERKWHSWLNGAVLTTCPSMWGRQRWLWWTSGETLLTTLHWPSTARLWRESAALNSWGCTSQRTSSDPPTPCQSQRCQSLIVWPTNTMSISNSFFRRLKRASLPTPILTTFYRETIESVLTSCITIWYGNCSAADRKTLQRTVNTAAKIIGAALPSIVDIFLTRCSSKANSIVKDLTHPSHSLFQLLPSGRWFRNIRARSARLLNSFFPRLWEPWTKKIPPPPSETPCTSWNMPPPTNIPHHRKKLPNFFCNSKCATHCWVGLYKPPVVTHSPLLALHLHTIVCTLIPQKTQ